MKNKLIIALLGFSIAQAAENKIDLSNASNDALSMFLKQLPATDAFISEITRCRNCNNDLYDRLIEAYLEKTKRFYIEEENIKDILEKNFSTCSNNKIDNKEYQKRIYDAFKRHIKKYPHAKYLNMLDKNIYAILKTELFAETPIYNQYQELNNLSDTRLDHELDYISEEDLVITLATLKLEKKLINNLYIYFLNIKKTSSRLHKAASTVTNNIIFFANDVNRSYTLRVVLVGGLGIYGYISKIDKEFAPLVNKLTLSQNLKLLAFTTTISLCTTIALKSIYWGIEMCSQRANTYSNNYLRSYVDVKQFLQEINDDIEYICDKIHNKINQLRKDRAA